MKKFIIYLLKPFSFLPALLVMYMIFSFSSQTGVDSGNLSYKVSYGIVSVADRVLEKNLSEGDKEYYAGEIELPVRKLAHMTEYCILAICISFPLYVYGLRGFWLFIFAGLFCVAFACTDEFHIVWNRAGPAILSRFYEAVPLIKIENIYTFYTGHVPIKCINIPDINFMRQLVF